MEEIIPYPSVHTLSGPTCVQLQCERRPTWLPQREDTLTCRWPHGLPSSPHESLACWLVDRSSPTIPCGRGGEGRGGERRRGEGRRGEGRGGEREGRGGEEEGTGGERREGGGEGRGGGTIVTRDQSVHYPMWCVRVSSVQRSADRRHNPGMQHDTVGQAKRGRGHHAQ